MAILSILLASSAWADDFARDSVVLHTYPSVGLVPSMKSWTVTWFSSDASVSRTLVYNGILNDMRIVAPAFDARCSLHAIRAVTGAYELVTIGFHGQVAAKYPLELAQVPSRMFIDRRGAHYISMMPLGMPLPYDIVVIDSKGAVASRIDLPKIDGVDGFDVSPDGCEIIYTTRGGIARFDLCRGMPIGTEIPAGRTSDVRLLPDGGFLAAGVTLDRYDAGGVRIASFGTNFWNTRWQSIAVAPDAQSFWAANPFLFRFALDTTEAMVEGKFVSGAITVAGMAVCGDWRAHWKRRAIRPAGQLREPSAPPSSASPRPPDSRRSASPARAREDGGPGSRHSR